MHSLDSAQIGLTPKLCFHLLRVAHISDLIAILMAITILQNLSKGLNSKIPRALLTEKKITKGSIILHYFLKTNSRIKKVTFMV